MLGDLALAKHIQGLNTVEGNVQWIRDFVLIEGASDVQHVHFIIFNQENVKYFFLIHVI
jgi:hypothetical protein